MANTYVDSNPINLKDRIAALEQRTSTPPTPEGSQPKPTGIPQLTNNVHLRDKIAKFERKGGVPVPRGRFGMGAPPIDSGKPKKQGELYGNRIPRIASASVARPGPGTQINRRSMSLSVATSDIQDYDASTPRSISPCPSDLDTTNSEAPLSPDAEKEYFMQEIDSPSSPATEITEPSEDSPTKPSNLSGHIRDAPEDTLGIPTEPNNQEAAPSDASAAPDVISQVVVTESASAQPEDASTVPEAIPQVIITGPGLMQPGHASEDNLDSETLPQPQVKEEAASADDITSSNKAEETEVERQLLNGEVVPPTEPEKKHEDELVDNKVDDFSEATSVVEEASSTSVSRSSSLRTLKPVHHATANTPTADEETAIMPEVPVISFSPPPAAAEDVTSPAVPSPLELYLPQGSERGARRISTGDLPLIASPSSAASSVSSPVEVQSESTSPAEPATRIPSRSFTRSPSPRGLPANQQDSVGDVLTRVSRKSTLSKVTTVEPLSEAAGLSSKEKITTPTVTVTSPPASKTPDSAPATLLYGIPDKRASTPSPSVLSPPSISGVLSPTSDSSSATQSPLASPTETVSDRTVMATAARSIPASLSLTNLTEEPGNSGLPAALSPASPSSRFMNPPAMGAMKDRPNTFHAVVHSKVRETAPALPTPTSTSQLLALLETPQVKKARQSGRVEIPTSPGTGELVSLLHEAALLENALAEGPLDLSLNLGGPAAQANRLSEEPQRNKVDRQRDQQRGIVHEPSVPKGDESNPGNLRSRLAFRLPLKKKTKHWKASSTTNAMLHEDLRVRRSLDTERLAGMSTPTEPTFLKIDPAAAKIARAEETQPNTPKTPEGFRQDSQYKTPPKSPRLLASFRRLTSIGSTKSLHTSGQQPRRSGSTWSELSSEDSVPVLTPPDASLYFARSDSKDGMSSNQSYHSTQSHGANIPWPSMSPKRTIARAASFAEKLFNRGRTKSNGSTLSALSAQEPRGGGSLNTSPRKAASSVNLTSTAPSSFRLDLPSLTPSESIFDSPLSGNSPTFSLPNPYSPSPSAHTTPAKGSASTSALANRHFPGTSALTDNESWISEVSQLDPALFDAFPSVPEQPVPTLSHRSGPPKKAAQHLPSINIGSSLSSFDPFFTNPPTPRSAQLPQRNGTLPPAAQPLQTSASDSTFLARGMVPSQRTEHHSGR